MAILLPAGVGIGLVDDQVTQGILYAICLGVIVWYIMKGQFVDGWIGDSYTEMANQIQSLESLIEKWRYSDGREVPFEKRSGIVQKHQRLVYKIQSHPDNPRNNR